MAAQLTIEEMRVMIQRLDQAKELVEEIPQSFIDRLEKSSQLLAEYRKMPAIDWDHIKTIDELEKAEAILQLTLELKNDMEKHFKTCGLTPQSGGMKRSGKTSRTRAPRRTREQVEYDLKLAEITKAKKGELNLPSRGRLTADDKAKLETAIEKEIKKQKIVAPKG